MIQVSPQVETWRPMPVLINEDDHFRFEDPENHMMASLSEYVSWGYFEPGKYLDHWVCEYWRADERRWVTVDPQIDGLQRAFAKVPFDTLDMPPDRFFTAGQAWQRSREGRLDPMRCGIAEWWGNGRDRRQP